MKKWFRVCSLALALAMGLSMTAFAKEERTKVGTVTINIDAEYAEKDEVDEILKYVRCQGLSLIIQAQLRKVASPGQNMIHPFLSSI